MKNIQVIDGADNAAYDIFAATDDEFALIFAPGCDVVFADEVYDRAGSAEIEAVLARIWARRVPKAQAQGIHGTYFADLPHKKAYYPTRRDEEAKNPDGTNLR
jgi:hypothetical protein